MARTGPAPAALLALAVPVAAGLAWMAAMGAPTQFLVVNGGALAAGLALVRFARFPRIAADTAAAIFLALLFLPLIAGPELNGVHRWIAAGPIGLNAALLAFPALAVLAAGMKPRWQGALSVGALAAAVVQPDASLALAVGGAAIGVALATRDTKPSLVAIAALLAAIWAHKRGLLPPQDFVERVYVDAALAGLPWVVLLVAASIAPLALIAMDHAMGQAQRFALAGAIAGFFYAAAMSNYPTPLIGYGAAPILGLALSLWLARKAEVRSDDQISSG